jgi:TonB family protein
LKWPPGERIIAQIEGFVAAPPLPQPKEFARTMADALQFVVKPPHLSERRMHSRQQVRSITYVELDQGNGGIVLNVSEGGLSVQAVVSLMEDQLPCMRIQLSQPKDWVETGARIAWAGESRKVIGLQFVDLPEQARSQIREWVSRETLPAPPPRESMARPGEEGQPPITAVASQAPVPHADPVALSPVEDHGRNVTPSTKAAVVVPIPRTEEATPVLTLRPMPAPERRSPPAPVPILSSVPEPASRTAGQVIGQVFDQTRYAELRLTGRPLKVASRAPNQVFGHGVLATLIAVPALMSLAAGWAAGRGAFDGVFAKARAMTSRKSPAIADAPSPSARPVARVPEIEGVDTSNQDRAILFAAPTPAPEQSPRWKAPASPAPQSRKMPVTLRARASSPTIHRQAAEYASGLEKDVPPLMTDLSGKPENILPPAGATDSRSLVPPPQVERGTRVLKRPELVYRVDPVYPMLAREQRIQGTVKLHVTIGQDGGVRNVELLSGSPLLSGAAISAVRQWRYSPMLLDGKPIQADNEISLVFLLP